MTKPSPLQMLVRSHNFSMGTLRRTEGNIQGWVCQSAKVAALNALEMERKVRKEVHEQRKRDLKAALATNREGTPSP